MTEDKNFMDKAVARRKKRRTSWTWLGLDEEQCGGGFGIGSKAGSIMQPAAPGTFHQLMFAWPGR